MTKPETKKEAKKPIDWEAIEKDWRAGIKSVLQIANEHDISHTAVNKHFKKLNVPRDLKAKIKAKAAALVSADAVSTGVSTETKATDVDIIDANAKIQAAVLIGHRKDIHRGRSLAMRLMQELEVVTDNKELLEEVGELMTETLPGAPRDEIKRMERLQQIFDAVLSSPGRIDSLKKLSDAMKNLIGLEREAFALNEDSTPEGDRKLTDDQVTNRINELLSKARKIP